ncbi:ABC transporter permease [Micromonospora andamanensis]|uniref:ABC transporter permease n=1 Tax=Micromonospora andamanensis TaxID=1287068 RepID=A0ABQ4HYH6_9ACTN|nr:ABC transporter permease [Micromonospora andamanensis]GIJ10718.1 ABC transporter permease [Micromonospora andamanensis]
MTAPTVNGVKYPQPVDALLPAARELTQELGTVPSRNRLMREFRIGAPKADELRSMLVGEAAALRMDYAEPIGPDPAPVESDPGTDPVDIPLDGGSAPSAGSDRVETLRAAMAVRGALLEPRPAPADTRIQPVAEPVSAPVTPLPAVQPDEQATTIGHPGTPTVDKPRKPVAVWPVVLLSLPAFVAVWSGWVGLGGLTGFGVVYPLPGIWDSLAINTAITLPIGVETYAAFALYVWLSGRVPPRARRFAKYSAIGSLLVGAAGQVAYHLLVAAGITVAPWWITTAVSVLPVAVLGMGAALAHLVREDH